MTNQTNRHKGKAKQTQHTSTIAQLLTLPVNNLHTRRILEILAPVRLFVEIDEHGSARLLGAAGREGHFQVGTLAGMQTWTPVQDQSLLCWKQTKGQGSILHQVQRHQHIASTDMEIVLVQHQVPTPAVPDINLVTVTPMWDKQRPLQSDARQYQAGCSYTCYLTLQCTCRLYISMLQEHQAQYYTQWRTS